MTAAPSLQIETHAHDFGARIDGVDLSRPLGAETIIAIRRAWLRHQVIYFPDQHLSHADLERVTLCFGAFGDNPYVKPLADHTHILEVRREPNEQAGPFGSSWHSDWSFQTNPPSATLLHAKVVPPIGGDTLFADGIRAYTTLDANLRQRIDGLQAIHSARRSYSREGYLRSGGSHRSMAIEPSDDAWQTCLHPLVRTHEESGRKALWVNPVYTIGIAGLSTRESDALLAELFAHALQDAYIYRHRWQPNMLTMWDNRSVQHAAQGGYDGHRRVMHRTTVAGTAPG